MKHFVSKTVREFRFSVIREMWQRSLAYENVISLGIGEPDFNTPGAVTRQALEDALAGHTHYTPSQGDPELVAELARAGSARLGRPLAPENALVTGGGMGALTCCLRALIDPGDKVLLPEPYFPDNIAHITLAGGVPVLVPTRFEDGWVVTPEAVRAAWQPGVKALLLNSPNNPTGAVIPGPVLDRLAELVTELDIVALSDEVYSRIAFNGPPQSIATRPGMAERAVVIDSFSKSHAMTGWRVGYLLGPAWLLEEAVKISTSTTSCASSVGQRAALAALRSGDAAAGAMAAEFARRSAYVSERLEAMPGLRLARPQGSFYLFPDVSRLTDDSEALALEILDAVQVVTVPGAAFGPSGARSLRLAATTGMERLAEAMDRLERFLKARA